jgi:hypothetical protein
MFLSRMKLSKSSRVVGSLLALGWMLGSAGTASAQPNPRDLKGYALQQYLDKYGGAGYSSPRFAPRPVYYVPAYTPVAPSYPAVTPAPVVAAPRGVSVPVTPPAVGTGDGMLPVIAGCAACGCCH